MTHPLDSAYPAPYQPCTNPACTALVVPGIAYCCYPCSIAHDRHYEIHEEGALGHTDDCKTRQLERRPSSPVAEPPTSYVASWRPEPSPIRWLG